MKNYFLDNPEVVVLLLIIVALLVCIVGGSIAMDTATCSAKTADIGFNHQWSFWGGCLIEVQPGQWIPLENYYFKQE